MMREQQALSPHIGGELCGLGVGRVTPSDVSRVLLVAVLGVEDQRVGTVAELREPASVVGGEPAQLHVAGEHDGAPAELEAERRAATGVPDVGPREAHAAPRVRAFGRQRVRHALSPHRIAQRHGEPGRPVDVEQELAHRAVRPGHAAHVQTPAVEEQRDEVRKAHHMIPVQVGHQQQGRHPVARVLAAQLGQTAAGIDHDPRAVQFERNARRKAAVASGARSTDRHAASTAPQSHAPRAVVRCVRLGHSSGGNPACDP